MIGKEMKNIILLISFIITCIPFPCFSALKSCVIGNSNHGSWHLIQITNGHCHYLFTSSNGQKYPIATSGNPVMQQLHKGSIVIVFYVHTWYAHPTTVISDYVSGMGYHPEANELCNSLAIEVGYPPEIGNDVPTEGMYTAQKFEWVCNDSEIIPNNNTGDSCPTIF